MNYIHQLNGFWAKAETCDITGVDIAVYMAILKYSNKLNWLNPFICHWDIICQYSKVSKNTYYKSIDRLSNLGFIEYRKGERNKLSSKILILKFENNKGTIKEQHEEQHEEQKGNLYKLLNKQTLKLVNDNYKVLNKKLEFWLSLEEEHKNNDDVYQSVDDLSKIYLSDSGILKAIIENKDFPVSSVNEINEKMKEFVLHLRSTGETTKKRKDFNRHFKSWVILKAKKEQENPKRFRLQMEDLKIKGDELDNSATIDIKEQLKLGT